jgi:tetrapyrrole methylase family protein/MazG family protein
MDPVIVTGLGPGDLDRLPGDIRSVLEDPAVTVILRTLRHPAAEQLAALRAVQACDDLYESADTFEDVYVQIAQRVLDCQGPVVYAVPGSPLIAERSVTRLREQARTAGRALSVRPAPSFLDEMFALLEIDPAARGFQVLDGRDLPSPMQHHLPTIVFHVDLPLVLADVLDTLRRVLPHDMAVHVIVDAGSRGARHTVHELSEVPLGLAGLRTSLYFDPPPAGYVGAVQAMRRLRDECPWDREQTHDSLVKYLIEETAEVVTAIAELTPGAPGGDDLDYGAYAELEDELGDLLLQVIFHANLAAEAAAFDIEDVAERLRSKLVRRHPHVFGDVEVADAEEVVRNWNEIKEVEKPRESLLDGIGPMPALQRATKVQSRVRNVGFDWDAIEPVLADVHEELEELRADLGHPERAADELGDVLFSVANLARHLDVDPEVALQRAVSRFEGRFRRMEAMGPLEGKSLDELDAWWEIAKHAEEEPNDAS